MGKGKILVIDDEKDITELLDEILSGEGYEVTTASNGKDALQSVGRCAPDLVILDMCMPKGGGVSFLHSIASHVDGSPRYPVLILTGRSEYETVFHDLPIDGFMTKPFQIPKLLEKVEKIVQKHQQLKPHSSVPAAGPSMIVDPVRRAPSGPRTGAEDAASSILPHLESLPSRFDKNVLVKDIMTTHVITAFADSSDKNLSDKLSKVTDLMRDHKIRHIPVVDNHQKLVGLISEDNLLRHISPKLTENGYEFDRDQMDELILEHVMTRDPVSIRPRDPIARAVSIMAREKFGVIPVVDADNTLVGIVSQIDFLRLLTKWLAA